MKWLLLSCSLILGCSTFIINGRNFKDSIIEVNNLELRISQIKSWGPSIKGKQWLKIDIYNPTDSAIDLDISKFIAVDAESKQLNCRYANVSSKNYPDLDEIKIYLSETTAVSLDIDFTKTILPRAKMETGIFFDKSAEFKKDKPFVLYYEKMKIAEIFK